jgi:hypothetical protein
MKFSAELNPTFGWKAQPEEAQICLRNRVDDAYQFDGSASLSESWLASQVGEGIGRNKFKLRTLIRSSQQKPPEVKQ